MLIPQRSVFAKYSLYFLGLTAVVLLFGMLGSRELWTQEWRWADICRDMLVRHDFLHPILENRPYYDKPLFSYWLMILTSYFTGLNTWAIRLPSVVSALVSIWCTYWLGYKLISREVAIFAGWLLVSTFYFIFWGRTGSADMLNVAGILLALVWYVRARNKLTLVNYAVFFVILAISALAKGLIAPAIVMISLIPDLLHQQNWKKHLKLSLLVSPLPALLIYLLPFWASSHFNSEVSAQNGLWLVFRENITRYFNAFDHQGHFYTYLIYLPLYTFPWSIAALCACIKLRSRWKSLSFNTQWLYWSSLLIFIFLSLSSSRRSYYVLPLVPFIILISAEWITSSLAAQKISRKMIVGFCLLEGLIFLIFMPIFYADGGFGNFAKDTKEIASKIQPWTAWQVVMLDAPDNRSSFYLNPHFPVDYLTKAQNHLDLFNPINPNKVIIMNKRDLPLIKSALTHFQIVDFTPTFGNRQLNIKNHDISVALIPKDF